MKTAYMLIMNLSFLGRGVVGGSILLTPKAVIFDPDPSDPLVEELDPEAFQVKLFVLC